MKKLLSRQERVCQYLSQIECLNFVGYVHHVMRPAVATATPGGGEIAVPRSMCVASLQLGSGAPSKDANVAPRAFRERSSYMQTHSQSSA